MSDFLAFSASDSGNLPQSTQLHTLVAPATATLQVVDETAGANTSEMLFEELLVATGSASLTPQEPVDVAQEESAFEALLPELPEEQVQQMAQQFLASLVNRDVPVLMSSAAPVAVEAVAAEVPVSHKAQALALTEKAERSAPETSGVVPPSVAANRHTEAPAPEHAELALPKTTLKPATVDSLRIAGINATPAGNVPVISAGQPHVQVNAPIRADRSGQELSTQLQHALGERLNLQINNQIQHATIRLDPPDMGRIEIAVQIEAGKIQVQINAGQGDVYRALQQVSNELRQALTEQHFVDVDVHLSNQTQQQQPGQRQQQSGRESEMILANEQQDTARDTRSRDDKSILMTV